MVFYTADLHFGHRNIIKYCNRPFKSLDSMNKTLINKWNARVRKKDIVIVNGDFCFRNTSNKGEGERNQFDYYADQLNGHKVFLQGNHDKHNGLKTGMRALVMNAHSRDIYITHNPSHITFGYDLYLTGHVHEKWKHKIVNDGEKNNLLINIGVDVWNFMPINIEEIMGYIRRNIR